MCHVSFPDPRLQTCLQHVCSVLAMSGQYEPIDRQSQKFSAIWVVYMVGAVLATNCKDTSNHLTVCWTNLVMHAAKL